MAIVIIHSKKMVHLFTELYSARCTDYECERASVGVDVRMRDEDPEVTSFAKIQSPLIELLS